MALVTVLLGCCGLFGVLALRYLVPVGFAQTVAAARPSMAREGPSPRLSTGLLMIGGALCLMALPLASIPIAESLNDWVDPDGDGMLGDMVAGSYDWFDINGGDFIRIWGLGSAVVLAVLVVLLRAVRVGSRGHEDEEFLRL